ncbi:hypothetical protein CYMTET_9275, partial [Cymbomonas tetramitiformis]
MAALKIDGRSLHWVFKIADRAETIQFYRDVLGMKALRHEEFKEGCAAACNGPYDGTWSKTMIGYGPEDSSFVLELTYNYGIKSYELGNDFNCINVKHSAAFDKLKASGVGETLGDGAILVRSPDGYAFKVEGGSAPTLSVTLNVVDLKKSLAYWNGLLGLAVLSSDATSASLSFGESQSALNLQQLPEGSAISRGTAFGRVAFSCPSSQLKSIEAAVKEAGHTVLTPYVSLDTPGKATVEVVILADPDGVEICFVNDEGFRDLSQVDPK